MRQVFPVHERPSTFRGSGTILHADTCRELVVAAKRRQVRFAALARGAYPGVRLPPRVLPHLKTVGFWDAALPQKWGLDWHRNEGIELTYLESGALPFAVENEQVTLHPGDLTITRPWQLHCVGRPHVTPGRLYWVILDVNVRKPHQPWRWPRWLVLSPGDLRALTALLRATDEPVWPATREVESCFQRIGKLIENLQEPAASASRLALLINELLVIVFETLRKRARPERATPPAEQATARFLAQLAHSVEEPWTLEGMASAAGLARTRFAHYCHKLTNRTPGEYLAHLRLEKARQLILSRPDRRITEIALECGFGSGQYFATLFRKKFRATPREYLHAQSD